MNDQAMQTAQLSHWSPGASRLPPHSAERPAGPPIGFGNFVVFPASRSVLCEGLPVPIGSRAFDLLMVLLRAWGTIVTKADIIRQVWPSMIVEDGNLRFQIVMLRKALGDERDRIKTIPGRGYLFVADAEDRECLREFGRIAPPRAMNRGSQAVSADDSAIVIVGADQEVCTALHRLLGSFGLHVAAFASVKAMLENQLPNASSPTVTPAGCNALGFHR